MELVSEAVAFAVRAHDGMRRKQSDAPYILHPMEAAVIVSTMTNDQDLIAAAALHDVVEDAGVTLDEIKERLNAELTHELAVEKVYFAERKFTDIAFSAYDYTLTLPEADEALAEKIKATLSDGPLTFMKKSKSGEREVDVRDFIHEFEVKYADGEIRLAVTLTAGEKNTLTPEAIVTVLKAKLGLFAGDPLKERYRILRRHVLMADGVSEFE